MVQSREGVQLAMKLFLKLSIFANQPGVFFDDEPGGTSLPSTGTI